MNQRRRSGAPRTLTDRQRRFVQAYVAAWPFLNAALAAREAGYSQRNSDVAGAKQKRKPHVRTAVDRRIAARRKRLEAQRREQEAALTRASMCRKLQAAGHSLEDAARISGYEPLAARGRKSHAEVEAIISRAMAALNLDSTDAASARG
jgi:phage terminase small subunit